MSRCARFTFVAAVAVLTGRAHAHFAMPVLAPVDRIIANVEAHLKEHPDDAQGYYTLGRAHYLAWILKSEQILEWGAYGAKKRLPHLPPDWMVNREQYLQRARWNEAERQVGAADAAVDPAYAKAVEERWQALQKQGWTPPTPDAKVLDAHAQQAVVHHRKAIELDMNNGLYHIGLASIMEQYATRAAEIGVHFNPLWDSRDMPTPEAMSRLWRLEALSEYRKSYESAIGQDRKRKHQPIEGLHGLVSYNAIEGYLRLADQLDAGDVDAPVVNRMRADKAKLDGLRMAAITPIVFAFEPVASLDDLLTLDRIVRFDLDGDGVAEQRPWVGPHTAILAWDPLRTGRITSGRQLFGNVTWWLFWPDGYRPMDALDDNRDGELSGEELRGLAVWVDRNGNAVSDAREVTPIDATAVAGLSVRPLSGEAGSPMHPRGLRLHDGRVLPTWDWVAPPAGAGHSPGR